MSTSLFELISDNIQSNDMLPEGFRLQTGTLSPSISRVRLVDGSLDGMYLYHNMPGNDDIDSLTNVIEEASRHDFESAEYDLIDFFSDNDVRMLPLVEKLEKWVNGNTDTIDAEALFEFAANIIIRTDNTECLKFALTVLEMMDTDDNDAVKDVVRTLARSDELTLFSIFIAETWKDSTEAILDFAKHVKGWGRIHCVEHIPAESGKVKDWLFREGVKNNIGAAYSARTVAEKINLARVFSNPKFNSGDYYLSRPIIDGLLNEGTIQGMSSMTDRTEIISGYLKQSENVEHTSESIETLLNLRDYLSNNIFTESGKLSERLEKLLNSKPITEYVQLMITEKRGFRIARRMSIDCTNEILDAMGSDFDANVSLIDILPKDDETLNKLFDIFRTKLPLQMMASGPKDNLGVGEEYRPYHQLSFLVQNLADTAGAGEEFIISSLNCPINANRQMALSTLEEWLKDEYVPSTAVKNAVWKLKETEPVEDIQNLLEKIKI
ncbi:hypothetical protein [Oribacterium sp. WCC10]|uniref:hypothetical protein n=1 Tax=Oribacterium sp. WCC10 TaxID=1855343 RepID=UPI0008E1D125|nr:hypothetical protein [Oribacterium sp. WCC10]SFG73438.1 hypothetical protein SAMN05216356_12229 [Oribacterium sp. WCC10]